MPRIPEEIAFWLRSGVFGAAIAGVYWYVSYEWAGSVLLALFGAASLFAAVILGFLVARRGRREEAGDATAAEGPLGDDRGRLPDRSTAPFVFGAGVAIAALALAYGPWLFLIAIGPLVVGAGSWIGGASAELQATEADESREIAPAEER